VFDGANRSTNSVNVVIKQDPPTHLFSWGVNTYGTLETVTYCRTNMSSSRNVIMTCWVFRMRLKYLSKDPAGNIIPGAWTAASLAMSPASKRITILKILTMLSYITWTLWSTNVFHNKFWELTIAVCVSPCMEAGIYSSCATLALGSDGKLWIWGEGGTTSDYGRPSVLTGTPDGYSPISVEENLQWMMQPPDGEGALSVPWSAPGPIFCQVSTPTIKNIATTPDAKFLLADDGRLYSWGGTTDGETGAGSVGVR